MKPANAGELNGTRIDRYIVGERMGEGGFGAVYRAKHSVLGTEVALKILAAERAASSGNVQRFIREAQAAARIGDPHIVGVHDAGVTPNGLPYLAMELLEGEDLSEHLKRERALAPRVALDIAKQTLSGLQAAHTQGIVHRDLKPANLFLTRNAQGQRFIKILDFGISKITTPGQLDKITRTGAILGTPAYMAPEQITNTHGVDQRADLYAMGVILFEMLTGQLPYATETFNDLIQRAQGEEAVPLEHVLRDASPQLTGAVNRSLRSDPALRFQTAFEFHAAIANVQNPGFIAPQPPHPPSANTGSMDDATHWPQSWVSPQASGAPPFHGDQLPPSAPGPRAPLQPTAEPAQGLPSTRPAKKASAMGVAFLVISAIGVSVLLFGMMFAVPAFITWYQTRMIERAMEQVPRIPTPTNPVPAPPRTSERHENTEIIPTEGQEGMTARTLPPDANACDFPPRLSVSNGFSPHVMMPAQCRVQASELIILSSGSANGPANAIDVSVERTVSPITLVLYSPNAIVWRLELAEDAEIVRVLTSGRTRSEVLGVPDGVRVEFHSTRERGWPPIVLGEDTGPSSTPATLRRAAERATQLQNSGQLTVFNTNRIRIEQ